MSSLAVIGAAGVLAQATLQRIDLESRRVVGIDVRDADRWRHRDTFHCVDLATAELKPLLEGIDTVVHLGGISDPIPDTALSARVNVEGTRRLLDAAAAVGVRKIIRLSTATVYGAWPNNPRPITEDAALRPNSGFSTAYEAAEVERLLADWRYDHPGTTVTVLRSAVVGGPGVDHLGARLLAGLPPIRVRGAEPRIQAVHLHDVAAAIALAIDADLDGVFNVAADGSVSALDARALSQMRIWPALPYQLLERMLTRGWASGASDLPPSALPLLVDPPVLANDRLRAAGWIPEYTNEEAILAAVDALAPITARTKRTAYAGVAGVVVVKLVAIAALVAAVRWRRGVRRAMRPSRG